MGEVSCTVMDAYDQVAESLEKEWDQLSAMTRGSIYLTFAWSRVWWEFYGRKKTLRIFVFRSNGKLVGVMPIYIEKIRIGPVTSRVARLVGAFNPPRVFDLPIVKEHAKEIGEQLAIQLLRIDKCDFISIGPVSDECEAKKPLFCAFQGMTNEVGIAEEASFGVYTYWDLPDDYEAYVKSLSKRNRRTCRECDRNLLDKEVDFQVAVMEGTDEIEAEMPKVLALHAEQWRNQGRLGSFDAWPQAAEFNVRLAVELARLGKTRLIKISNGGKPILYEYSYIFGDCCYWQVSARKEGEKWDRLHLGVMGALVVIRNMIGKSIRRIECGLSHYEYKMRLGGIESRISVLRSTGRRATSMRKYHLCMALSKFYAYFYYRLWYSRIQPRLPVLFRRPISMNNVRMTF